MGRVSREVFAARWWIYGVGLAVLSALQVLTVPRRVDAAVTAVVLIAMVAVYSLERLEVGRLASPPLLGLAFAGVVIGVALITADRSVGVVFVAGGVLFLIRAVPTGGES